MTATRTTIRRVCPYCKGVGSVPNTSLSNLVGALLFGGCLAINVVALCFTGSCFSLATLSAKWYLYVQVVGSAIVFSICLRRTRTRSSCPACKGRRRVAETTVVVDLKGNAE